MHIQAASAISSGNPPERLPSGELAQWKLFIDDQDSTPWCFCRTIEEEWAWCEEFGLRRYEDPFSSECLVRAWTHQSPVAQLPRRLIIFERDPEPVSLRKLPVARRTNLKKTFVMARKPSRYRMICAQPSCSFLVHQEERFGGFCCKKCHWCLEEKVQPLEHGKNCNRQLAPTVPLLSKFFVRAEAQAPEMPLSDMKKRSKQRGKARLRGIRDGWQVV